MGAIVAADFRWQGDRWNCNMAAPLWRLWGPLPSHGLKEALENGSQ